MIYVYEDPVEFVRRRAKQVNDGQYRLILLFLGTQFDEDFLKDIEALTPDLDALTGPHAMAVLFTPPPTSFADEGSGFGGFRALGRFYKWAEWDEFVGTMTDATYSVAASLGIPFEDLPAIVFLDPDEDEPEFAVWKLKETPFRKLYTDLRSALNRWYKDNADLIERIKFLQTIRKFPWEKVPSKQPEMATFKQFVEASVVPKLLDAAEFSGVSDEVKERIQRLSEQPRNADFLRPALRRSPLPLCVEDRVWTADSFSKEFFAFVHADANRQRRALLKSMKFPLQRVAGTTRKLAFQRFFDRVDLGSIEAEAGGVKFKYNPLSMIRHAFGVKDQA
jgi:hypothetical protein